MCRNRLGQFSSPSNPSAVKDVQFRRGSLYRIVGSGVARFKGVVDNLAVLTIHGKPTVVATERVKLADKEDVDLYLADARNR